MRNFVALDSFNFENTLYESLFWADMETESI